MTGVWVWKTEVVDLDKGLRHGGRLVPERGGNPEPEIPTPSVP